MRIPPRLPNVFYGWRVVAASCTLMGLSSGIITYSATVFFNPVATSLHLSRTVMSLATSLARAENFILAPVAGYFIDRFGSRGPIVVGLSLAGTGLILFGLFANSLLTFVLTWTMMVAIGVNVGGFAPNWAAINNWFIRRKGRAMGFGMASQALGGVVLAPAVAVMIARWGWRPSAMVAGLLLLGVGLPVSRMIRTRPEEMGLRPDGDPPSASPAPTEAPVLPATSEVAHLTVREAAKTPSLWILVVAMGLRQFGQQGLILHLSPLLQDRGYSPVLAGVLVGFLALMGMVGAVSSGWVSDRFQRRLVMASIVTCETLAILTLLRATHLWQVLLFIAVYGYGQGAHALNRAILGDYFGQRHYAKIWGIMSMSTTPFAALGPIYAGWTFDHTQGYGGALLTYVGVYAVAALFYANCRRPALPERLRQLRKSTPGV